MVIVANGDNKHNIKGVEM